MKVKDNLAVIHEKIEKACAKAGRKTDEVNIVAVTKYVSIDRAKEAVQAGLVHLGENRDDGLLRKYEALGEEPIWHFIGSLQTRKVKQIIHKAAYIHSLDRISLAKEINKRADKPVKCFVQVNVSGEASKHGLAPEEVEGFIQQLQAYPNIVVVGLMTMAPHIHDQDALRTYFRKLKDLQQDIQHLGLDNAPCKELSMGMSNDYEIAIEEGATFVRLGTSLVGEG